MTGSSAFVLGGLLQAVGIEFGIRVAAAGQMMTAYVLSTAVLAPLLLVLTARWFSKHAIQLALALFTLGCFGSALATDLTTLLFG